MKTVLRCLTVLTVFGALTPPARVLAQADNEWIGAGVSTNGWNVDGNWSAGFHPDPNFDDNAKLGADTGVAGVPDAIEVTLSTDLTSTPSPRVILGDGSGYQGTLNLQSGAKFVTTTGSQASSADFDVGLNGGVGILNVAGTAQLDVGGRLANSSGGAASTISLQDAAAVTAGAFYNEHIMRISGSGVNFSVSGNAVLAGAGAHEWEFSLTGASAGPSAMLVGGQLSLGGTLKLDMLGETPAVGDSYVIADSQSVTQGFASVDTSEISGFAALGQGVMARAISAPDAASTNGVLTRVVIEQQPVLVVNRRSGEVSIRNPSAANAAVGFDAYVVGSDRGSLNAASWMHIAPGSDWQEANPSSSALSELNPLSSHSVAADTTVSLGAVFQPADGSFGENIEDITFRFAPDGEGFVNGLVVYEGIPTDTLTLNVDRTTGAAQILNGFREGVSIDLYVIRSESGAIDTSGFAPLGGDWQVALNEQGVVSELNPLASLDLSANQGQSLGSLFDFEGAGAQEDLVFQFSLPTENFFRTGKVVFDNQLTDLQSSLQGDYNDDGVVDAADYTVWRDNLSLSADALSGNGTGDLSGLVVTADYDLWRSQYGATAASPLIATATPAPEPALAFPLAIALGAIGSVERRRNSRLSRWQPVRTGPWPGQ